MLSTYEYYDAVRDDLAKQLPSMDKAALEGIALTHIPLAMAVAKFLDTLDGRDAEEVQAATQELSIVYDAVQQQPKGTA